MIEPQLFIKSDVLRADSDEKYIFVLCMSGGHELVSKATKTRTYMLSVDLMEKKSPVL